MEFTKPYESDWTIYTKSGCPMCVKVKDLLIGENTEIINCDDYLKTDRTAFLFWMKCISGKEIKSFPMVFYSGRYVGGYLETCRLLEF